jgi:hypothetical protein
VVVVKRVEIVEAEVVVAAVEVTVEVPEVEG